MPCSTLYRCNAIHALALSAHEQGTKAMTTQQSGSAEIIQFPARGRFAAGLQQNSASAASMNAPRIARVAAGGAWYHDEAIRDAADECKN
jgi:hypothetical protein